MDALDCFVYFWITQQMLLNSKYVAHPITTIPSASYVRPRSSFDIETLVNPYIFPASHPAHLLHVNPVALEAYYYLWSHFYRRLSCEVRHYLSPYLSQQISSQTYQYISTQVCRYMPFRVQQLLWTQINERLSEKYGANYVEIYHEHFVPYWLGLGAPPRSTHYGDLLPNDPSAATSPTYLGDSVFRPLHEAPLASSATTPHYTNQRVPSIFGDFMPWIDSPDHPLVVSLAHPSNQAFSSMGICEGQADQDSVISPSAHLALDDDLGDNSPSDAPSQEDMHAFSSPLSMGNQHMHSPASLSEEASSVGPAPSENWAPGLDQGQPDPSDNGTTFTDELTEEFRVGKKSQMRSGGRFPCFMCRQRFADIHQALRHIECHILVEAWICTEGPCADEQTDTPPHRLLPPGLRGKIFFRKDNFVMHATRMHKVSDAGEMAMCTRRAKRVCRSLPKWLDCTVTGCGTRCEGKDINIIRKLLKHVVKCHAAELGAGSNTWRNGVLPYLLDCRVVVQQGDERLRAATYKDVSFLRLCFVTLPMPLSM